LSVLLQGLKVQKCCESSSISLGMLYGTDLFTIMYFMIWFKKNMSQ